MSQRYFHTGGPMPKVGSVAHTLYGQNSPQFVRAEDYDRAVEERNAAQAAVEWHADQLSAARMGLLYCGVLAVGFLVLSFYLAWEAIK